MAALLWNQWQASNGMGGSFRMESVADIIWNTHTFAIRTALILVVILHR